MPRFRNTWTDETLDSSYIRDLDDSITRLRLPYAEGALFDAYSSQLYTTCHKATRLHVLQRIRDWFDKPSGPPILWLNGMAGVGKSTICRTVAEEFTKRQQLGATFFFKRGEGDTGNVSKFIGTICNQLAERSPATKYREALLEKLRLSSGPRVGGLDSQFSSYLEGMFADDSFETRLLVIIDAMDECENQANVPLLLRLFGRPSLKMYTGANSLRILIACRPESYVRTTFDSLARECFEELNLQDESDDMIAQDIQVYMADEFARTTSTRLDQDTIKQLQAVAGNLFVAAATICRFIGDTRWDVNDQIQAILKGQDIGQKDALAGIYQPILNRILLDLTTQQQERMLREFHSIVGPLVVLADSLSVEPLVVLLNISRSLVELRLGSIGSLFRMPKTSEGSIQLLHETLREFLLDPARSMDRFWVNTEKAHETLTFRCLQLLTTTDVLKRDICNLKKLDVIRDNIEPDIVAGCIPPELQYACRYWIYHLSSAAQVNIDLTLCYEFLYTKFLYWVEALALLGCAYEIRGMLTELRSIVMV